MDTKYTNALEDNTATMMLYGEIGSPEMSAEYFAQEMKWHNSLGRKIKVYINSPGGNVFGGYSLIQAIIDYEADTHIVGLAASMGGIISQFGKRRTANDFAVGMIHMPSGGDSDKLLNIVSESLIDILVNRCGKPKNEIEALMEEETFFSAEEMLDIGLIDEIVTTNVAAVENVKTLSVGDLYNVYNTLLINNEMEKLKTHFKLDKNATEDAILNSITTLENEISTGKEDISAKDAEIAKLQNDLEEIRASFTELNDSLADQIVDSAIEEGKVEKTKKDIWLDAAKKDPKGVKAQLDSIAAVSNHSVQTAIINKSTDGVKPAEKPEDDIKKWVRNNGAELIRLEQDEPDEFERIMNLYEEETSKIKY